MVDRKRFRKGEHSVYVTAKSNGGQSWLGTQNLRSTEHLADSGECILGVSQTLTTVAFSPETFKTLGRVARN